MSLMRSLKALYRTINATPPIELALILVALPVAVVYAYVKTGEVPPRL